MSLSSVQSTLSTLKSCQADIGACMDMVSDVALGIVETGVKALDEDIAVTQSQTNFICPLTQVKMVNPVKNKKCVHHYDQEAVLEMIKAKHKNKKKFRCPKVGCGNADVQRSDLELDLLMKRMIQNHKRQSGKT
uniref:E3 SUMO-protein ligase NSE2 n=1 Tax=Sinocyclocheilus rhinocerous TaxID=307959 RepID=A0A673JNY7_9TELE